MNISTPKQKREKARNVPKSYGQKEVDFSAILPMPEGYEKLFLTLYFLTIPYVVGLIFLFIFVARGDVTNFIQLDIAMFVAVWAIGYEIVGGFSLIVIFYKMFTYNRAIKKEVTRTRDAAPTELHKVHRFS